MTQHDESKNNTPSEPPKQTKNKLWSKVKNYLIKVLIFFVISSIAAQIVARLSVKGLRQFNDSLIQGVAQLNPWNLAKLFYPALFVGGIFDICKPCKAVSLLLFPLNIPYAVFSTARSLISEGAVSAFTALVAFLLGLLVFVDIRKSRRKEEIDWGAFWYKVVLFGPVIGSCMMWVLLQIMHLTSFLLGWALSAVETITYISVSIPLLGLLAKAAFKPIESSLEDRVVGGMAKKISGS